MKVLLSIKPEFADKIFKGEKRFEYRKISFSRDVTTVVLYVTQPVKRIVGEFDIEKILSGKPFDIWEETKEQAGISEDFFTQYFSGRNFGYAIKIKNTRKYSKAINPYSQIAGFTPPQSFRYLD